MNFRFIKPVLKASEHYINKRFCSKSITAILKNNNIGDTVAIKVTMYIHFYLYKYDSFVTIYYLLQGWIKSLRKQKDNVFIDLSDGSSEKKIQIVLPLALVEQHLSTGASVNVVGTLTLSPKGQLELHASKLDIYGECVITNGYPFAPRKTYSSEYIRQFLHFRPRTNKFASLLRVRNTANVAIHNYFNSEGFVHIHTPILTSNDSEGAGEVFTVLPDNTELLKSMVRENIPLEEAFFDKKAYLSVSGQLHLEAAAHGLTKVYSFGPTFRAENSKTRLHLSEFYMLESEIAFLDELSQLTSEVEKLVKTITKSILDSSQEDIAICRNKENSTDFSWLNSKFAIMPYTEALDILEKNRSKLKQYNPVEGFSKEHEIFLVGYNGGIPIFIIDWPKEMKAFYMRECKYDNTKVRKIYWNYFILLIDLNFKGVSTGFVGFQCRGSSRR